MKKTILTIGLVLASIITLSSLNYNQAEDKIVRTPEIQFIVPIAPKSTIITNENNVHKYLRRGYQIQNAWSSTYNHLDMYVVVKY